MRPFSSTVLLNTVASAVLSACGNNTSALINVSVNDCCNTGLPAASTKSASGIDGAPPSTSSSYKSKSQSSQGSSDKGFTGADIESPKIARIELVKASRLATSDSFDGDSSCGVNRLIERLTTTRPFSFNIH